LDKQENFSIAPGHGRDRYNAAMTFGPLLDATALARAIGRADYIVVDCRFTLTDPSAGRAERDMRISTTTSRAARIPAKAVIRCRSASASPRRSAAGASAATMP
jgi:hypothetical protein